MIRSIVALAVVLALLEFSASAGAQNDQPRVLEGGQQGALDAVAMPTVPLLKPGRGGTPTLLIVGDAIPLKRILSGLRGQYPGQVLDAQLIERDGQPFYRIKLLGADGSVQVLIVDARTGAVVETR